ncbi:MAG: hypothetical protein WA705_26515 [Candidatus Ozemobacteraceae bacterium]
MKRITPKAFIRPALLLFVGIILLVCNPVPASALDEGSAKALEAFRRYEPEFTTSLRRLQDGARKIKAENLDLTTGKGAEAKLDAADILEFVQKRYDMLDDLQKTVAADHPADRAAIYQGFQRIDDLYRECRSCYQDNYEIPEEPKEGKAPKAPAPKVKPVSSASESTALPVAAPIAPISPLSSVASPPAIVHTEYATPENTAGEAGTSNKVRISGLLRYDIRNRNEKYDATLNSAAYALPNNFNQSRLMLRYDMDPKNKIVLEDKYAERRRNELMKENTLTFSYLHNRSKKNSFSFKDTLHHVYYPEANQKDYRDNLAEVFWNNKDGKWERLLNLGLQNRDYQNYTVSNFKQFNLDGQNTYFIPNGTVFTEYTYNARTYKDSPSLDYTGAIYDFEFNRSYDGNKSEIAVGETWEGRNQGNENKDFYRSSYWDNFFRFRYDLPVSKTFAWVFEDEHQQRVYGGDDLRGYALLKLKTTAKITIDKDTRARLSHTYTFNDENQKAKAYKNHVLAGVWEKKVSPSFKIKVEDSYFRRDGLQDSRIAFRENVLTVTPSWKLPSKIDLAWKNEYLFRNYNVLGAPYAHYKYFQTGIQASYALPKKYDWQFDAMSRNFSYQPLGGGWNSKTQPLFQAKGNIHVRKDLKVNLLASTEKTFYRYFDTIAQELLWNFNQPYTITEFLAGIEYQF